MTQTPPTTLLQFLRDRLDEDERGAVAASPGPWHVGEEADEVLAVDGITVADGFALSGRQLRATTAHIARHDPARVLADAEAKRQLIARGGPFCTSGCDEPGNEPKDPATNWTTPLEHHFDCAAYEAAKVLALPYAAHPEFREEGRP